MRVTIVGYTKGSRSGARLAWLEWAAQGMAVHGTRMCDSVQQGREVVSGFGTAKPRRVRRGGVGSSKGSKSRSKAVHG